MGVSTSCRIIRQNDEQFCPTCGLRWELYEDRPVCSLRQDVEIKTLPKKKKLGSALRKKDRYVRN